MSTCPFSTSWTLGCKDNLGGGVKVYMRTFSSSTVNTYDATGVITGATNTGSSWYTLSQRQGTLEFKPGTGAYSNENGTGVYISSLSMTFHKYAASLRNLIYTLGLNDVEYIVLDNNGKYFLGSSETAGAYATASDSSLGKSLEDLNGSNITFESKLTAPAREVSSTFISTLTFV